MIDEDDGCIHGLGPKSACTICNGSERRAAQAQFSEPVRRIPIEAKYESHCHECDLPISVGQRILWARGEPSIHASCDGADQVDAARYSVGFRRGRQT